MISYISNIDVRVAQNRNNMRALRETYVNGVDIAVMKRVHVAVWEETIREQR
jgi:hypothetical protein